MKRRNFLRTVSLSGGVCTLSGCLSAVTGHSQSGTPDRETTTEGSRGCEPIVSDTDRVVCQRGTAELAEMVSVESESETFTVSTDTGEITSFLFTLHNRTKRAFVFRPDGWHIARQTQDEWELYAVGEGTADEMTVVPGDDHTWALSPQPHPTPRADTTTHVFTALPSGTHKFVLTGHFDAEPAVQIELQASFTLETSSTEQ
ncbi:hypothetical protein [Halocatena pleomorpha]|uniref:Uncharacterized protein n=1 Tax=Halocatena pleomorpha TaxID=1785090 RepID=A0A3P3R997_9EURY|nr:hypothetical protein [Halocatena pleomorpha]RRJ29240.1 hypothetical protein EIK79_13985 [Halocatena pleomorpha]